MAENKIINEIIDNILAANNTSSDDLAKINEIIGNPVFARGINEIKEFAQKYPIEPGIGYSAVGKITPNGYEFFQRALHKVYEYGEDHPEALQCFMKLGLNNNDFFDLVNKLLNIEERKLSREFIDFKVNSHDQIYHGTSFGNYQTIIESGSINISNYSGRMNPTHFDISNFDGYRSNSGMVFLTDSFDTATRFALNRTDDGVILGLDMFGHTLKKSINSGYMTREFSSISPIPIKYVKKVYHVEIVENKIVVNEMEDSR